VDTEIIPSGFVTKHLVCVHGPLVIVVIDQLEPDKHLDIREKGHRSGKIMCHNALDDDFIVIR
jgi:hypothetical protein